MISPILFALVVAASHPAVVPPAGPPPNFLVIVADDLTHHALGAAGNPDVKTPNIDKLARRGMMFTHAYIQGGLSGAVCVASRARLATGRSLWRCGDQGNCSPDGGATLYPLWGETLAKAGYRTVAIGKWHNGAKTLSASFANHKQTILGGMLVSTPENGEAYRRPAPGNTWTPDDPRWAGHWLQRDGKVRHSSELWADAAVEAIEASRRDPAPFFLYLAFHAPHDPRQAPRSYVEKYKADRLTLPPNLAPKHPFDLGEFANRDEMLAPYPRTEAVVREHLREYYAIIDHMDAQIGRVLDALEREGKSKDTVVVFTADNGLAVGRHGLLGKQELYDHSIRVPLIFAGPGIPAGETSDRFVDNASLFATTCEMASIPLPTTVDLPGLLPVLQGKGTPRNEEFAAGYMNKQRMIRTRQWKLVESPIAGRVQLFDMEADPWEMRDRSSDPSLRGLVQELHGRLKARCAALGDRLDRSVLDETLKTARLLP